MKTIRIILLFFLLFCCAIGLRAQQANKLVIPISKPGQPYELNIHADAAVTVSSYEGKEIIIETGGTEKPIVNENGISRISGQSSGLRAEENDNVVIIRSLPRAEFSMTLRIPSNLIRLKIISVSRNSNDITVNNVSGELEITNNNGGIKLSNISGSVVSSTLKGNIVAAFRSVNPKAAMAFSAFNGSIDVSFPQNIKANVKLNSARGSILSDFDLQPGQSVTRTAEGNKLYRYRIDKSINASINGGGPEIVIKTITGDINIRKLK